MYPKDYIYDINIDDETGNINISLVDKRTNAECGSILFKYNDESDTLSIVNVQCTCLELRGDCLSILIRKMLDYSKHESFTLSISITPNTKVELMVEPDGHEYGSEQYNVAFNKLKSHYAKLGFRTDPELPAYMETKVGKLSQNGSRTGGKSKRNKKRNKRKTKGNKRNTKRNKN
jgi:hypothetical protein